MLRAEYLQSSPSLMKQVAVCTTCCRSVNLIRVRSADAPLLDIIIRGSYLNPIKILKKTLTGLWIRPITDSNSLGFVHRRLLGTQLVSVISIYIC